MPRVDLPQGTVSYRSAGPVDGRYPPVVFLHGMLVNSELWTEVAHTLADRGIRSFAPDLPLGSHPHALCAGADLTPRGVARLVLDFLVALDLTDVTLVGNDTGTALCQFVVDEDASRIGRLVLTNGDAFDRFPPPLFVPLVKIAGLPAGFFTLMSLQRITAIRHLFLGQNVLKPLDVALTRRWITPALTNSGVRRDTVKFLRSIDRTELVDISTRLEQFTKPVVLLWGDGDPFFPIGLADRLQAAFPNARLTTVSGGRLFLPLDEPQRVAEEVQLALTTEGRQ